MLFMSRLRLGLPPGVRQTVKTLVTVLTDDNCFPSIKQSNYSGGVGEAETGSDGDQPESRNSRPELIKTMGESAILPARSRARVGTLAGGGVIPASATPTFCPIAPQNP